MPSATRSTKFLARAGAAKTSAAAAYAHDQIEQV
jgi:hypothetical protein